jgi:hypothetical protein
MPLQTFLKWNSFHPFGCAINNSENIIIIVTILEWAHQIHMEDGLGGQVCVAVDLAPLAGDVAGKSVPHKPG